MPSFLRRKSARSFAVPAVVAMLGTFAATAANASEKVLYSFRGGSDGASPYAGVITDKAGNLYGTTTTGGTAGPGCQSSGCGVLFKLAPGGTESVLYAFQGGNDGIGPYGSLLMDKAGDFYGVTGGGGNGGGWGTVFKLTPEGTESVLYSFQGGSDGRFPFAPLIADRKGNLYGTTDEGGNYIGSDCSEFGCGTVFKVQPDGNKITLYEFQGGSDGALSYGGVIADSAGNLYGTTGAGGDGGCGGGGCGTVFKLAPDGTETILYAFRGDTDGDEPEAGLVMDNGGNLYGTTFLGGAGSAGTVFEVSPSGAETILYAFKRGTDGANPESALIMDKSGNLYGTTYNGGSNGCRKSGCGTVFELAPDGTETVLYAFRKHQGQYPHGQYPAGGLLLGKSGLLYGTATAGGPDNVGVVFSVKQ